MYGIFFKYLNKITFLNPNNLGLKKAANPFSSNSRWKFFQDQLKRDFPEMSFEDLKRLNLVPGYKNF